MVVINKTECYPYDFCYIFKFDYDLNLEKAHEVLRKYSQTKYTRWVPKVVPAPPREKGGWQLRVGPTNYAYPHNALVRDREIVFRGFFPMERPLNYMYYLVRDFFKPFAKEGLITEKDYEEILKHFAPVKELVVLIRGFRFHLKEDWDYKILVETPPTWLQDWQAEMFGRAYSVKHRTVMLLETLGIAPRYFAGYRFVHLSEEAIKRRIEAGRRLKVWRTMQYDPNNRISVEETATNIWEVDLGNFRRVLLPSLPLEQIEKKIRDLGYSYI